MTRREAISLLAAPALAAEPVYWPKSSDWETRTPAQSGMDGDAVEEALRYAGEHHSTGVVALRHGRIVAERYWDNWKRDSAGPIYSASKSLASTLIGMAIGDGKAKGVHQSMADFVPAWKGSEKEKITIRHALTMTSGIKVGVDQPAPGAYQFDATAALPLEHPPGTHWAYNTPVYRMLLSVVEVATGETLPEYTRRKVLAPLGMEHGEWQNQPAGERLNWTWFSCSIRDMCRFGLLASRGGEWNGKQLVSAKYLKEAITSSQEMNRSYGYLWWLNGQTSHLLPAGAAREGMLWPDCPADAYGALGALDKKIYVVPSLDLVVARHGGAAGVARVAGPNQSFDNELLGRFCRAVKDRR